MENLSTLLITILYMIGCFITYNDFTRNQWWFVPLGVLLGLIGSFVWYYTCKVVEDKERILVLSLVWDSILIAVYYGMPILFFNVKLDKISTIGAIFILVGIIILKFK